MGLFESHWDREKRESSIHAGRTAYNLVRSMEYQLAAKDREINELRRRIEQLEARLT